MFWLKACPRCKGDLIREVRDPKAPFCCLQCGHETERPDPRALRRLRVQRALATA